MRSKTIVSIAAAALLTTGALAIAAPGHGEKSHRAHGEKHGTMQQRLAEKLGLSEAQKTQMKDLMASFRAENQTLMDAMKQTREQLRAARQAKDTARAASLAATAEEQRAEMEKRREAQHQRMLQILTPEQRLQMEQMHEQMKGRHGEMKEKRMDGHAGHHGANAQ
jgi:Spy/CpxP family protein refolding chaperone